MNKTRTSHLRSRIAGFQVHVHEGKEVSATQATLLNIKTPGSVATRVNGPHHDAEWAKNLSRHKASPRCFDLRGVHEVLGNKPEYKHLAGHLTVCC